MISQQPLHGIRVVDLTRVLAGPYCTMILKNLGAEIIKVEAPTGDDSRQFGPFIDGKPEKSAYFYSINCGKKSVALDLKTDGGKEILADLIRKTDVLFENFRPGTLARLGFSKEHIRELNPDIIDASASGFGQTGPDSKKAAYDSIVQALSGIISITGTEAGEMVRVGTSISDIITGCYSAIGILAALFRREKGGAGASLDIAMLDSTVSALENAIARYQVSGESPAPLGSRHPSITPFETFKTRDGEIMIAAGNDKLFAALCEVISNPGLAEDNRFASNLARTENFKSLREAINSVMVTETAAHWLEKLTVRKIPCGRINTIEDLFQDKQLDARNMLTPIQGEESFKIAGNPVKFTGEEDPIEAEAPPQLGEHNSEILKMLLGYSDQKITELLRGKVLFEHIQPGQANP
jgi:CoA:oxalate CoA-transferase